MPPMVAILLVCLAWPGCASRRPRAPDYGIPGCLRSAESDLLSSDALQCWFTAPQGRWRTLGHQSHLEALVVQVQAVNIRDAENIARRFVESPSAQPFAEILVYVQTAVDGSAVPVRRVRWTRASGFDTLDYTSPPGDPPLTVRSLQRC
jgi:hypothetical protein